MRSGFEPAPQTASPPHADLVLAAACAAVVPCLLAFNLPPSSTLLNQATALVGWGGVALVSAARAPVAAGRADAGLIAAVAALGLLFVAALAAPSWTTQPGSIAVSNAGMIAAAVATLLVGAQARATGRAEVLFQALCWAWIVAGLGSLAIGCLQVFLPDLPDGDWIARSGFPGRAVGNLRQPNHLSSLLLWSAIAAVALAEVRALARGLAAALFAGFVFGIVLSASRTGLVGVGLLALWGLLDRRLDRRSRILLLLAPLIYALCWGGLAVWAHVSAHVFGGEERFSAEGDLSSSRFAIWSNTLSLIARHPWGGVGFGEFNFAWTLTPFPQRPVAFFDHAHNLVLQFAVELGLPLATLVLALLGFALWRAWRASSQASGHEGTCLRAAFMMVLMMALHSQLEYPLWYAYFLLPTALVFGLGLGSVPVAPALAQGDDRRASRTRAGLSLAAVLVMAGGAALAVDYLSAVAIYTASEHSPPLSQRIEAGQRSLFFAHQGDYAAATTAEEPGDAVEAARRAAHNLLDARLMMAWARGLAAAGDVERARHVAARLREFHHEQAESFFAPCDKPATEAEPKPFQCQPPSKPMDYRDFR